MSKDDFIERYLREERRKLRKEKGCMNCRYRIWYERPKKRNPCAGCYSYKGAEHWKRRRLWQMIRDLIERRKWRKK